MVGSYTAHPTSDSHEVSVRPLFDGFLAQGDKAMEKDIPSRDVFGTLLSEISHDLPSDSQVALNDQKRTNHDYFCKQDFVLLDETIAVEDTPSRVVAPYVIYRVRDHISH